ncbi:MAG TPA: hypothetical protein VM658_09860 [bacterium]|nr:hypothetical protein [bacterium]
MPWTIESALEGESITEPIQLLSEFEFHVGELTTPIRIKLFRRIGGKEVWFRQSHFIHTPSQFDPYMTSLPFADDEAYALHRAVDSIVSYYEAAIKDGHTPDEKWLVPNEGFH